MNSVEIKFKTKEKEVTFTSAPKNTQDLLILMSSVFTFLNQEIDESLFTSNYTKLEQMYINFHENQYLKNATEENEVITPDTMAIAAEEQKESQSDGIKLFNNKKHYKTKYKCKCGHPGFRYIPHVSAKIICHNCGKNLQAKYVHPESTPNKLIPNEHHVYFESYY